MKRVLHSGEFLDYDGNTIRVTFYNEKHLWVSKKNLADLPHNGCEIEVEVWSDAGTAGISPSSFNWVSATPTTRYTNKDGCVVTKYNITVAASQSSFVRGAKLMVGVTLNTGENFSGYDTTKLSDTITITQI